MPLTARWHALLLVLTTTLVAALAAPASAASPNAQITSDSHLQIETSLAIANDNTTMVAAFTDKSLPGGQGNCAFSHSSDGGLHWSPPQFLPKITPAGGGTFEHGADPAIAYSAKHNTFNYLCLAVDAATHRTAILYETSNNGGTSWSDPQTIYESDTSNADKEYLAIDNSSSSPFYGRIYATWIIASAAGKNWVAESHLIGTQWSSTQLISDGAKAPWGPMVAAGGPRGFAYIGWCSKLTGSGSCHDPNVAEMLVSRSTTGGVSWDPASIAQTFTGVPTTPPAEPFRINSFGTLSVNPVNDAVRLVYTAWNGTDTDVMFTHSTDFGAHWSSPINVDTSPADDQFFPWIAALPGGFLWVCYYDEHYTGKLDVSCSRTTTGTSFEPVRRVTNVSSTGGNFIGDYIGAAAGPDAKPAVLWTDFRNGNGDIYFGRP